MSRNKPIPRLFIMCGLPYAGKSTLAALIARLVPARLVSLDAINAERGLDGGEGIPEAEWARTHRVALERVDAALAEGASVVVDDTNCHRFLRDNFRRLAEAAGIPAVVVYLPESTDVALDRLRRNRSSPDRPRVREDVLAGVAAKFEPPQPDEPTWVFDGTESPERWVRRCTGGAAGSA